MKLLIGKIVSIYNKHSNIWGTVIKAVVILITAILVPILSECVSRGSLMITMQWLRTVVGIKVIINIAALSVFVLAAVAFITTKLSVAVGFYSIAMIVMHAINFYKIEFRNEPFFPWDITLFGEATEISSQMNFMVPNSLIYSSVIVLLIIAASVCIDIFVKYNKAFPYYFRLLASIACIAAVVLIFNGRFLNKEYCKTNEISIVIWDQSNSYNNNGFIYSFLINYQNREVEKPSGYSQQAVVDALSDYQAVDGLKPNIIYIMSEAFIDATEFSNIEFGEDIAPTLHMLQEKYISGYTLSPAFGGGTSLSEFEVLTGYSTVNFPSGTTPYMQYVNLKTDSYASFLKSIGYTTLAIHPYKKTFWSRNKAYELMGFDKFISDEDFIEPELVRLNLISDKSMSERLIEEFKQAREQSESPFFAFLVSMQNHASYADYDYPASQLVDTKKLTDDVPDGLLKSLPSYAKGVKDADASLKMIIDFFDSLDEPTVVVFFGDHLPSLGPTDYLFEGGYVTDEQNSPAAIRRLQSTPYVVWNNFSDEINIQTDMSMYQLVPFVTTTLNLSRPAFYGFLTDQTSIIRGYMGSVGIDNNNQAISSLNEQQLMALDIHWLLTYDNMFGKKYGQSLMWGN